MKALWLALSAVAAGGALFAQAPLPQTPPTFRSNTELVEVDVAVTDAQGRPIRGLTKDDFAIPGQTIVAFQEVSHDEPTDPERAAMLRVPHDVADNQIARTATLAVIVLDDGVPRAERERARDTVRQIVDKLGPGVQIGLMSMSGRLGFELTDDRARLLRAIDRLRWRDVPMVLRAGRVVTGSCNFGVFEQAARMLAPMPARRKAVIAVTPGCPGDIKGAVESMAYMTDTQHAAVQMVDVMRRANVAYYGIDPRGAVGYSLGHFTAPDLVGRPDGTGAGVSYRASPHAFGMVMETRHFDPVVQSQDNIAAVGEVTGGFSVTNTADIDAGIRRLVDDFDHYYLIGFTPSKTRGFEKLTVRVSRQDAVLRYRRGYQTGGVRRRSSGDVPLPSISGVMPVADVPLRLLAMPFATRTGARELMAIELRADRADLGASGGGLFDDVTVTVVAVRADQARVERAFTFTRHVTITPEFAKEAGDTVAYQIVRAIDLPPGPYQFRVSVTSARIARTGSVYLTTDVPDYASRPFELSGPLLAFADSRRHPAAATLVDAGLPSIAPVFDRVFSTDDALRVLCPFFGGDATPAGARVDLVNERGAVVSTKDVGVQTSGIYGVDAVLNLKGLPSGPYRLRVTASTRDASSTREVGIAIR